MGRRAQTAIEFLVLLGFMLLVFTAFFAVMHERSSIILEQNRYGELIAIGEVIQDEAVIASRVHNGYRRVFDLPRAVQGEPYTVKLDDSTEIVIKTAEQEYILFLPVNMSIILNGVPSSDGDLAAGRNIIKRSNGNVTITPITASISATPNPCTRGASPSCTTTVSWSGRAEHTYFQVWVQQENGAETYTTQCTPQPDLRSYQTTIDSSWYTFRLYPATGCTSGERVGGIGQELASVVVTSTP